VVETTPRGRGRDPIRRLEPAATGTAGLLTGQPMRADVATTSYVR
jgi:hypothetical protein